MFRDDFTDFQCCVFDRYSKKNVGALTLNIPKYASSYFKRLNMQEYGSSRFSTHKVLPHMIEPEIVKKGRFKHPRQAGFGSHFFENLMSPVWELLFQASESVGALVFLPKQRFVSLQADHIKTEAS